MLRLDATRRRRIAAVLVAGVLLAGCANEVGSAAIVGGSTISLSDIHPQAAQPSQVPSGSLATDRDATSALIVTQRNVLSAEIVHQILQQNQLLEPVPADQLNQLTQQYPCGELQKELLATDATLSARISDTVALSALLDTAVQGGEPLTYPVADVLYAQYPTVADATADYQRFVADPGAFDAFVAESTTNRGQATLDPVSFPDFGANGAFSAQPGTVLLLPIQGAAVIVKIVAQRTEQQTVTADQLTSATPRVRNILGGFVLAQHVADGSVATPAVEVNPRFGSWNAGLLQVAG